MAMVLTWRGIGLTVESGNGDTWINETAQAACVEIGGYYGICPELLMAIIERESWGGPKTQNGSCKGLMQVSEKWHKDRMEKLGVEDLFDEYGNILVGTDYLLELFEKYEDPGLVLMIYNGDSHAFENAENGVLSDYAKGILERSEYLERLHEAQIGGTG